MRRNVYEPTGTATSGAISTEEDCPETSNPSTSSHEWTVVPKSLLLPLKKSTAAVKTDDCENNNCD